MQSLMLKLTVLLMAVHDIWGLGIPMVITKGSHFDVGVDMGRTFVHEIQQVFCDHPQFNAVWLPWSHTAEGGKTLDGFLTAAMKHFPQYVEEIRGLSHGANITFQQMFLMAHGPEVSAIMKGKNSSLPQLGKGCTDVFVNQPHSGYISLGHNEDNGPYNTGFLVSAHIIDTTHKGPYGKTEERFTGFSYFGVLPGEAFGYNQAGVVVTCNAEYPTTIALGKIGRNILNRALLSVETAEEALAMLSDKTLGAAYGFTINLGSIKRGQPPKLWNIEVAPDIKGPGSKVNVYPVLPESNNAGTYYHVNMYRRINDKQFSDSIVSSEHRTKRIQQLPVAASKRGVFAILGDTLDPDFPLFRTPRPTDEEATLATAYFDLRNCSMEVYRGNPKTQQPLYTFPIPC